MTTNEPPQNAVMEPCPIMAAFKRIASKSRNGVGEANFERYKENEQDVITVQHFLLNVETPLTSAVTEIDVESLKRAFQAGFEISAEGCNGEYNDGEDMSGYLERGFNVFLKASGLLSKYPQRFK